MRIRRFGMHIPICYDALKQFETRDRMQARAAMSRPWCQCCGAPIQTETALDLSPFGLTGFACQRCVDRHTCDEHIWLS